MIAAIRITVFSFLTIKGSWKQDAFKKFNEDNNIFQFYY